MATKSSHSITITFTGDTQAVESIPIADNAISPGQPGAYVNLANGNNTIMLPVAGGALPIGVWIIPPVNNVTSITLKGSGADSGISLHLTNAHYQSFGSSVVSFILGAGGTINGVRLVWV